jgi:hypothetical protein
MILLDTNLMSPQPLQNQGRFRTYFPSVILRTP